MLTRSSPLSPLCKSLPPSPPSPSPPPLSEVTLSISHPVLQSASLPFPLLPLLLFLPASLPLSSCLAILLICSSSLSLSLSFSIALSSFLFCFLVFCLVLFSFSFVSPCQYLSLAFLFSPVIKFSFTSWISIFLSSLFALISFLASFRAFSFLSCVLSFPPPPLLYVFLLMLFPYALQHSSGGDVFDIAVT